MNVHQHPHYSFVKALLVYSLAVLFLLYEMGLQVSPSVMAFDLMKSLNIQAAGLGIMAGSYFYSYSIMQLPGGLLYDRFGARILICVAILICAAGAFFFGFTQTVFWASFARFLMGFGSAFAFTGVLVVSAYWFQPHHFAFLAGMAQFFAAIGALGGAYPMAILVGKFGWREVIISLGFVGVLLSLLAWLIIRDHPKEKCSPSLVKTPQIRQSIKEVFHKGQNWWAALFAFTAWSPVTLFAALWGVPFLVSKYNVSNQLAAFSISFIWIGMAISSPLFGWLSDHIKRRVSILIVMSTIGLLATLFLIYVPKVPFWTTFITLFCLGSAGSSQVLTFAIIKDTNRPSILATAMGFNNMAVVLGGAIFQPLVGIILSLVWHGEMDNGERFYSAFDYQHALLIMPICYLVCLIVSSFALKETHCKPLYMKSQKS